MDNWIVSVGNIIYCDTWMRILNYKKNYTFYYPPSSRRILIQKMPIFLIGVLRQYKIIVNVMRFNVQTLLCQPAQSSLHNYFYFGGNNLLIHHLCIIIFFTNCLEKVVDLSSSFHQIIWFNPFFCNYRVMGN